MAFTSRPGRLGAFVPLALVAALIGLYVSVSAHDGGGRQIFVAQSGTGAETGKSCASAHSLAWLNSGGDWGSGADVVGPGATVDLCGTFTHPIETLGSGEAGRPIALRFTRGAKIAIAGNGCPGSGCIDVKSGSDYITVTSVAGYKGQIENTERSYAKEHEEGPGTTGVKAFGCEHCKIENLEIGPLYVAGKGDIVGDTEIQGITIDDEDGEPAYDTIRRNYLHDLGWAVNIQNGKTSGHIYVEHNTFYHLTHGLYLGTNAAGASIGEETFAHNRFYGNSNWEDGEADTNHVDGVHCAADAADLSHYAGLFIYDNYITTEGANTTGPIFLEGANDGTPCSDKTSNVWIFNNVLTGNTCCGLAGAFTGEDHTFNNTMIGAGPGTEQGGKETCETWDSDTKEGRVLTVGNRAFKNNVVTGCQDLISAEKFLAAPDGMEHNLWADAGDGNEAFACEHGEVETSSEQREAFHSGAFGAWARCMEQPESDSSYVRTAKLELRGQAQAPLGEPESGSRAIGQGKNLSRLCSQTPEKALCRNIRGERRAATGAWNIGAY
jgi:hypothetical protein